MAHSTTRKKEPHLIVAATLVFLVCIPTWFLIRWEFNLHCTQHTSFSIVLFDWEPHIEDRPGAPIYHDPWGMTIRFLVACMTVMSLYLPAAACLLGSLRRKPAYMLWGIGILATAVFLFTSSPLGGERTSSLAIATAILGLLLYGMPLFLWLIRRTSDG